VEDASDQEIKDLSEELAKLRVTCKENDTKMHSQQELSMLPQKPIPGICYVLLC